MPFNFANDKLAEFKYFIASRAVFEKIAFHYSEILSKFKSEYVY